MPIKTELPCGTARRFKLETSNEKMNRYSTVMLVLAKERAVQRQVTSMARAILARAVFISSIASVSVNTWAIGLNSPVRQDDAFAVIAAETVKDGYRQYPPFYNNVIAPHALVAHGKVYCAFQNTDGQPIVTAYDISKKRWS